MSAQSLREYNGNGGEHSEKDAVYEKLSRIETKMEFMLTHVQSLDSIATSIKTIARNDLIKMLVVGAIILLVVINDRKISMKLGPLEIGQSHAEAKQ